MERQYKDNFAKLDWGLYFVFTFLLNFNVSCIKSEKVVSEPIVDSWESYETEANSDSAEISNSPDWLPPNSTDLMPAEAPTSSDNSSTSYTPSTSSTNMAFINTECYATFSKAKADELTDYLMDRDIDACNNMLINGDLVRLNRGESVYFEGLSGIAYSKVRQAGSRHILYLPREYVTY